MLSTPPKSFQQIMKPVRGKCQRANLLNPKQSNTWAGHFPSCSISTSTHAEFTATHTSCNIKQGCIMVTKREIVSPHSQAADTHANPNIQLCLESEKFYDPHA